MNLQLFLELFSSIDLISRGIYLLISFVFIKFCCLQVLCLQIYVILLSFPEAYKSCNSLTNIVLHLPTP